ncbi:AraC family transcriptional regulator [Aquincola sp. S2]|uniref:AraC family transcriptional regulator n=1 Tax=Pseudaquabacterium terrae TaxID=2732868 RepID=A0ABX2EFE7_9BURK|nr:AraC family transcriptional regulator [Aquabacterium terrae]NRF67349.1 AraC family transcriptional regulator [Aquabacterium terrae]
MLSLDEARTLFDACPDVVFFAKDRLGRYTGANRTLLQRLGLADESALLGRTPRELFPEPLGASYHAQDLAVIASGRPLLDELERHLFPNHAHGWCLTRKLPLQRAGRTVGVIGISRDLPLSAQSAHVIGRLQRVIEHVQATFASEIRIGDLAAMAHLSVAQFERQFARVMQITPKRWLISVRLEAAMRALEAGGESVAAIAQASGFADHSAFTRSFRKHVGLTPTQYQQATRR